MARMTYAEFLGLCRKHRDRFEKGGDVYAGAAVAALGDGQPDSAASSIEVYAKQLNAHRNWSDLVAMLEAADTAPEARAAMLDTILTKRAEERDSCIRLLEGVDPIGHRCGSGQPFYLARRIQRALFWGGRDGGGASVEWAIAEGIDCGEPSPEDEPEATGGLAYPLPSVPPPGASPLADLKAVAAAIREAGATIPEDYPEIDTARDAVIARIRKALRSRSDRAWSVTGGRGTAWGWITIDAPPARRTWRHEETGERDDRHNMIYREVDAGKPGGHTGPADRAELARLLGFDPDGVHPQGVSIASSGDHYREYVDRAEGRAPRAIGQQYWD